MKARNTPGRYARFTCLAAVLLSTVVPACGGDDGPSESDKQDLVSDVIAQLLLTGRFTTTQLNCLEAALISNYSSDEIVLLSSSSTATPALLARYRNDTQRCLVQQ